MLIKGTVKSKIGFYIGDICYALPEHTYHKVWGGAFDITLPDGKSVIINTADLAVGFDDEDEEEPEYWWQKY